MAGFSILKKADSPKDDKKPQEANVPQELPPLGEDAIKKDAPQAKSADIPDELPPIDFPEQKPDTNQAPSSEQKDSVDLLLELPAEKAVEQPELVVQEAAAPEVSGGFFANLFGVIKKPGLSHRLYKEDLVARMKENWEVKDTAVKKGITVSDENELARKLETTLNDLRVAESRWRTQKIALEENQRLLKEREDEIRAKSEDFKKILRKTQLMSSVPREKALMLKNSISISNIAELIAALKKMDNKIFSYHCSQTRNDFYDFTRHISHDVADKIKGVRLRTAMINVLEESVKEVMKE